MCPNQIQGIHDGQTPLCAFAATNDPDTLYHHEAMAAPDRKEFIKAMTKEVDGQIKLGVFEVVPRTSVPKDAPILPAVWAMRRRRRQTTGEVYKWKSRLNIGGQKMVEGRDYDQTYAPVASWPAIRTMLSMVLLHGWHTRQVDYVQAYPQAPAGRPMYMQVPVGCEIPGRNAKDYLLLIKRNIYGGKDAGRVWYLYLRAKLEKIGFSASENDECVFFKGRVMYVLYTDDSILAGPDPKELDDVLRQIRAVGLEVTSEGGLDDFLGVNIDRKEDGSVHLTQPRLIQSILEDLGLDRDNVAVKDTPMATSKLIQTLRRSMNTLTIGASSESFSSWRNQPGQSWPMQYISVLGFPQAPSMNTVKLSNGLVGISKAPWRKVSSCGRTDVPSTSMSMQISLDSGIIQLPMSTKVHRRTSTPSATPTTSERSCQDSDPRELLHVCFYISIYMIHRTNTFKVYQVATCGSREQRVSGRLFHS